MKNPLAHLSLLSKIMLSTSIAITLHFAVTGWIVQRQFFRSASQTLEEEVQGSFKSYESLWQARADQLSAVSMVLSRMSDVRAAFGTHDHLTIRDTAEEIWRSLAGQNPLDAESVHLAGFPKVEPEWQDAGMAKKWERLLEIRTAVQAALEEQRRNKVIGSSLEAVVEIQANPETYSFLKAYEADLSTFFIVSAAKLTELRRPDEPEFTVAVSKATAKKCERCWNYREAVGTNAAHPTLCDRCVEAVQ